MALEARLEPLRRADGSASFSCYGHSVLAAVNGPIEVQRRDEIPGEAALEVTVRPATGVGGKHHLALYPRVRERHFESIIHKALHHIVQLTAHPRTLIQVVLQVTAGPAGDTPSARLSQAASNLSLLPALLNAASLALLSTSLPLNMTLTSTIIAVVSEGIVDNPNPEQLEEASSTHVLAFSSKGELLVVESEGPFEIDLWEAVVDRGYHICHAEVEDDGTQDTKMENEGNDEMESFVKSIVGAKVAMDEGWRQSIK